MATIQFMSPVLMDKCVHVDLTIWYHGIQISIAHVLSSALFNFWFIHVNLNYVHHISKEIIYREKTKARFCKQPQFCIWSDAFTSIHTRKNW